MWIQIIKTRIKHGKEAELTAVMDRLKATEQPNSGLLRSIATRDQHDPNSIYLIVMFESEEKARAREQDPRRQAGLTGVRQLMGQVFDGEREFLDLEVVTEYAGS